MCRIALACSPLQCVSSPPPLPLVLVVIGVGLLLLVRKFARKAVGLDHPITTDEED